MNRHQFAQLASVCLTLMFAPFVIWDAFAQSGVFASSWECQPEGR